MKESWHTHVRMFDEISKGCAQIEWVMAHKNERVCYVCMFDEMFDEMFGEVGGWGRDPKKCTGRDWGMGSSTI